MGNVVEFVGCKCSKYEDEQTTTKNSVDHEEISQPLMDIKIDAKNFIRENAEDCLTNYEKITQLGSGSYGSVYKVLKKSTNQLRALKIIPKYFAKEKKEILNEINILKGLDHPNVMKIYEFFEDGFNFYLIEELCDGGDLKKLMHENKTFCEFLVKYIMYQIFLAVNYLHINKVVHGDIKRGNISIISMSNQNYYDNNSNNKTPPPENKDIFNIINNDKEICEEFNNANGIDELSPKAKNYLKELIQYEIKVIDFGEADFFLVNKKKVKDVKGTLVYLSPELLNGQMIKELDEWACGILMYFLLVGCPPFDGETEEEIINKIINKNININYPKIKNFSIECRDLLTKLLNKNYSERITAKNALEHEFFKKGIQIDILIGGFKNTKFKQESLQNLADNFYEKKNSGHQNATDIFRKAIIAYIALNFSDKEEQNHITQLFHTLAKNNKNKLINKDVFIENMKIATNKFSDKELEELFDDIDENKSGVIEYEELFRAISDKQKLLSEKNLRDAFNFFDTNKNGKISWDEISGIVFQNNEKKDGNDIAKMFMEENYAGRKEINITFDEFCKILKDR